MTNTSSENSLHVPKPNMIIFTVIEIVYIPLCEKVNNHINNEVEEYEKDEKSEKIIKAEKELSEPLQNNDCQDQENDFDFKKVFNDFKHKNELRELITIEGFDNFLGNINSTNIISAIKDTLIENQNLLSEADSEDSSSETIKIDFKNSGYGISLLEESEDVMLPTKNTMLKIIKEMHTLQNKADIDLFMLTPVIVTPLLLALLTYRKSIIDVIIHMKNEAIKKNIIEMLLNVIPSCSIIHYHLSKING